ncbi:hypothetical protein PYW08_016847 [Mythimna loreyi]|uniref:Uncharacterized protein n=1 Tax=Mythimna loreyi TaxID=667449 RepID=A0ACC2R0J1_9NEOP|nr:hypothetical protein PYW08_016847 [Mythimna loreyi]
MSSLQHTPPPAKATNIKITVPKSLSDMDIPQTLCSDNTSINTSKRYNKRRLQSPPAPPSPDSKPVDSDSDLRTLLESWKKEHDEHVNKLYAQQSSMLDKLVAEIADLKLQNSSIQTVNLEIKGSMEYINTSFEDMRQQVDTLRKENRAYKNCINELENKIQDLQQSTRSSCVVFRNIPTKENETISDLSTIVEKVSTAVNMPLSKLEIRDVYRLPGKKGAAGPIITEFQTVHTKNQLITNVRNYNKKQPKGDTLNTHNIGFTGNQQPIYVAEHLPSSMRKLFFRAREFAKNQNYMFCWIKHGNIFLRKETGAQQILIKSERCLTNLVTNLLTQ